MQDLRTSTFIRKGLKYLWNGQTTDELGNDLKEEFLCHAIMRAGRGGDVGWGMYTYRSTQEVERRLQDIRDVIEQRLFPYSSLAAWLTYCGDVRQADLTSVNLQKHRRKWALKMIAEFKAKGD